MINFEELDNFFSNPDNLINEFLPKQQQKSLKIKDAFKLDNSNNFSKVIADELNLDVMDFNDKIDKVLNAFEKWQKNYSKIREELHFAISLYKKQQSLITIEEARLNEKDLDILNNCGLKELQNSYSQLEENLIKHLKIKELAKEYYENGMKVLTFKKLFFHNWNYSFGICTICNSRNISFSLQCGHTYCQDCVEKLTKCAYCRGSVLTRNKLHIY